MSVTSSGRISVGHPVDVASGVVFTASHDFVLPGPRKTVWERFYATSWLGSTCLGIGWRHNFELTLTRTATGFELTHEDGIIPFTPDPYSGQMVNHPHRTELLVTASEVRAWDWGLCQSLYFEPVPGMADVWRVAAIITRHGYRTAFVYDAGGRLDRLLQPPTGRALVLTYHGDLLASVHLEAHGHDPLPLVRYDYDDAGRLTAARDAAGAAVTYRYDAHHRLVAETNKLGGTFHFTYGADGRCVHNAGDGGFGERWLACDVRARITRVRDSRGAVWSYHWNTDGQVVREVDPTGAVVETVFDLVGRTRQQIFTDGSMLQIDYDTGGHIAATIDGIGHRTTYAYDRLHLVTRITHPDGSEESWTYDTRGNVLTYTDQMGAVTYYERDQHGRATTQIKPSGARIDIIYGQDESWHELVFGTGSFWRFEYDIVGRLLRVRNARGTVEERLYDLVGNLQTYRYPDGSEFHLAFDVDGNVLAETDQTGNTTRYAYHVFGHRLATQFPDGSVVRYGYDREGQLSSVTNEDGLHARFELDSLGRLVAQTFFDGRTERYSYDARGGLTAIQRPDGRVIERSLDVLGRLVSERCEGVLLSSFVYDAIGRVVEAVTADCTLRFAYDKAGRVIREEQNDRVIIRELDATRTRVRQRYTADGATTVEFAFDGRELLTAIAVNGVRQQSFAYDAIDARVERALFNGDTVERWAVDERGRATQQEVQGLHQVLVRRRYRYDPAGRLVQIDEQPRVPANFAYDSRDRLLTASSQDGSVTLSYDRAGNLLKCGPYRYTYAANRLTRSGDTLLEYDENGHRSIERASAGTTRYDYDVKGFLRQVHQGIGREVRFGYDAFGRRVSKIVDGAATIYVWAGHELIAEHRPDGALVEYIAFNQEQLAQRVGGTWLAVVTNALGRPSELIDEAGRVVWRAGHTVTGALVAPQHSELASPFRMEGQYDDPETGLHYNRYRYYDPFAGSFITPDPIGFRGGLNEYRWVENWINWRDPLGLACKLIHFRIKVNLSLGPLSTWLGKRDSFNQAASNPNARIPTASDYRNNIRPAADREAAAARVALGLAGPAVHADHPGDVRATGLLGQPLQPLVGGVNTSWGSQVGRQTSNYAPGTPTPRADLVDQNGNIIP
jgi:RHS repeat-associated protein